MRHLSPQVRRLLLLLVALAGCGQNLGASVKGKVTVGGKPLSTGTIVFHPKGGRGSLASANIGADGSYELLTGKLDSMPAGEYGVTVVAVEGELFPTAQNPNPQVTRLVGERYALEETSGLKYTIAPGENTIDINLESPAGT